MESNQLPSAIEAEKSILSSVLQDPAQCLDRAIELGVTEDWFHGYSNKTMWENLHAMLKAGESLDLVTLNTKAHGSEHPGQNWRHVIRGGDCWLCDQLSPL